MSEMGTYYNLNAQEINKGKRLTLGAALKGAATVTVTYISGGSTLTAVVPSSIAIALKALGLAGSINVKSDLESAYESAISEVQSRIWSTSAAIARYQRAHDAYSLVLSSHNSQYHGEPSSYRLAHTIDTFTTVALNTSLPSFTCPGGGCSIRWTMPSDARESHYAKCGTSDDPYHQTLKGCYEVYYTCNSSDNARHKPQDCGLSKWIQTTHGWTETACPGDYRKCMPGRIQREHSTFLTGVNVTSTCGGSRPSAPPSTVNNPPPPLPPTDDTPNCQDCTSHCSSPCSCTNSGTCNGTVAAPPPPEPEPTLVACGRSACTASVSSSTEHQSSPCAAGDTYYTCNPNVNVSQWENRHRVRTCRRSGCGNTWQLCQSSTPSCSAKSGKRCSAR